VIKPLPRRPLHFIFVISCSASMAVEGKIQALNNAIRELIPGIRKAARENPGVEFKVRAIKFSSRAEWHIPGELPIEDFEWKDLTVGSEASNLGPALELLVDALDIKKIGTRAKPPVLVLISDGQCTDDWQSSLDKLNRLPWGRKAVRVAVAIGQDANRDVLQQFLNNPEFKVLEASNAPSLVDYIKWVGPPFVQKASEEETPETLAQITVSDTSDVW